MITPIQKRIIKLKKPHFDTLKGKYVSDNRKNRRRLEKQGDLSRVIKNSTFMNRFYMKLNELKNNNTIHLSIREIKNHFGKECIVNMGITVLNALHNKRVMMKVGNNRIPLNIENIRNLSKWFYVFENQENFTSDESFKKAIMNKPYITFIPLSMKHRREIHSGAFFCMV